MGAQSSGTMMRNDEIEVGTDGLMSGKRPLIAPSTADRMVASGLGSLRSSQRPGFLAGYCSFTFESPVLLWKCAPSSLRRRGTVVSSGSFRS